MAQSLDPDKRSENRSESPAGSIFRRLFAFWRNDDDMAPEVAPTLPPQQRKRSRASVSGSQAFTIWTAKAIPPAPARELSENGRYIVREFDGFTLWSTAEAVAKLGSGAPIAPPVPIALPASQAFSTWTTPAALASQAERWTQPSIKLPPSEAFTLWTLAGVREMIVARWEKPATISLPESQAFSAWTTPAALASQAERWTPLPIKLPPSEAFTLWTLADILPLLADRWAGTDRASTIHLTEPQPFTAWTRPADLDAMAARWNNACQQAMITLKDPQPFSIWTQLSAAGPAVIAAEFEADPAPVAAPSITLIRLQKSDAHSVWTTVEGLATSAARWIPGNATAKVAPIPAALGDEAKPSGGDQSEKSNITPFPSSGIQPETDHHFANQNTMDDNNTNPIKLANSNAFTVWSTPDKWTPNTISSTTASGAESSSESAAPAAFVDKPKESPAPAEHAATATATAGASSGDDAGAFWKWAFILAALLGLGIIVTQAGALGDAKKDIKEEAASRLKVVEERDAQVTENGDLTQQLVESSANIQTLANEKADLQADMGKKIEALSGTIEGQKAELAAKANKVTDMESALGTMKAENEAAANKISELAKEVEAKALTLKETGAALDTTKAQAAKLDADLKAQQATTSNLEAASKELDAKLKMSSNDQEALAKELTASTDALSSSKEKATSLEKQIADMKAKIAELEKPAAPAPAPAQP